MEVFIFEKDWRSGDGIKQANFVGEGEMVYSYHELLIRVQDVYLV